MLVFHFAEWPRNASEMSHNSHEMASNAIGKFVAGATWKKRYNWSVCDTHTRGTTQRVGEGGGVATWSNMQIIAKWKCVCKVKRSTTRKVSQTLFGWLWASTTFCKQTTSSSNSDNNNNTRHQGQPSFSHRQWAWLVASIYLRHARECKQIKLQIMISCLTARTPLSYSPLSPTHLRHDKTRATKMSHTNCAMYEHFNIIIYSHTLRPLRAAPRIVL